MSFAGEAGARPPRVSFTALATGETFFMPFVPETFKEGVKANYSDQTILGMSHKNRQYSHTDNHTFEKMSFFFKGETIAQVDQIHEGRKFLLSLCYAAAGAGSVREGGPTRVLFIWPQVVTMTCVIDEVGITHERFNRSGRTVQFRAEIAFGEIRDRRLTAEDVRENGTQRSPDIGSQLQDMPAFLEDDLELRDLPPELES